MDPSTIDESVDMKGPTPNSNWVIPGKLIAGAYPGDISSEFCHQDTILSIIDAGVTTIVSLMTEDEVVNCNFKPYKEIATEYATERQRAVEFISFPIPDCFITMDSDVMDFIPKLAERVTTKSECVYIHCRCGHGRTGTIIALLLARLYGLSSERALHLTGFFHGQRVNKKSRSPQTRAQCDQVTKLAVRLHREDNNC